MDIWEVSWRDAQDRPQRREFPTFDAAWLFNEQELKGKGEVRLLTDRPLHHQDRPSRNEAENARRQEGGRRYVRKK